MLQRSYNQHNSHSKITNKLLYVLPGMALMIVAILAVMKTTTLATDTASAVADYGRGATFSVQQDLSLNIAINDIDIPEITPTATGAFQSGSVSLTVDTSNTFGYTLKMYAYDPYDTSSTPTATTNLTNPTALSSGADAIIETIASGSYTEAEFIASSATVNKWAYKNGTNYVPVATETTLTPHDSQGVYNETVTFGAKVNSEKPNGLYSVTLNFVATVNPPDASDPRSGFAQAFQYAGVDTYGTTGLYAMQDMTSTICGYIYKPSATGAPNTVDENTKSIQLVDKRDKKTYWVTKLADGKCWMTQNLDFDITGPLDSTTTNLTVSGTAPYITNYSKDETTGKITWTPSSSLYTISASTTNQAFTWSNNYNNPESVDLGDWYYRSDYYNNDDCGDQGCNYHTGNAGSQFSQTPGANGAHSHVGNYYNWSAAVASSNTSGYDSGNAVNSLCPANWNLPVNGMYGTLNSLYNPNITTATELGSTAAADKALLAAPLYFVRAGDVWSSALHYAGHGGLYWSSTVYSSSYARYLIFRSSGVWPADGLDRSNGRSLRCVAAS